MNNPKLTLMPGEKDVDRAMDEAMQEIDRQPKDADLTQRSRAAFEKSLSELSVKSETIRQQIAEFKKVRAREIAKLDTDLKAKMVIADAELARIAVLEIAIETAISTLS
jgi:septal ring factor EnvC (AmiA/AmiB activator)